MDTLQQFENTKVQFMAQINNLSHQLKLCAEVADQYHQLVAAMPYMGAGANGPVFPPLPALASLQPGVAPLPAGPGRKRKNAADDAGPGGRKVKPKRDPELPKRAPSAYLFYQNAVRGEMKAKNSFMPHHELLSLIAKQWSQMSDDEKAPYEQQQRTAKSTYETQMTSYNTKHGIEAKGKKGKSPAAVISPPVVEAVVEAVVDEDAEGEGDDTSSTSNADPSTTDEGSDDEEEDEEEEQVKKVVAKPPSRATKAKKTKA